MVDNCMIQRHMFGLVKAALQFTPRNYYIYDLHKHDRRRPSMATNFNTSVNGQAIIKATRVHVWSCGMCLWQRCLEITHTSKINKHSPLFDRWFSPKKTCGRFGDRLFYRMRSHTGGPYWKHNMPSELNSFTPPSHLISKQTRLLCSHPPDEWLCLCFGPEMNHEGKVHYSFGEKKVWWKKGKKTLLSPFRDVIVPVLILTYQPLFYGPTESKNF